MEEILARAVQIFLALAGGYLVVLWFALVVWTYRDIGSRSQSVVTQIFATLLSLLFFVPGTLLYLLMRPRVTIDEAFQRSLEEEYLLQDLEDTALCPSCQRQVSDEFILCPHCQANLKRACTSCTQLINVEWPVCPYCGSDQTEHAISIRERVEPPEERYLERGAGSFRQVTAPTIRASVMPEPAIHAGYDHEIAATVPVVESEPAEPIALEEEPIKLFDRKRTRARRQQSKVAHSEPTPEPTGSDGVAAAPSVDHEAAEDSEVIAQFVANGANGHHETDSAAAVEADADAAEQPSGETAETVRSG